MIDLKPVPRTGNRAPRFGGVSKLALPTLCAVIIVAGVMLLRSSLQKEPPVIQPSKGQSASAPIVGFQDSQDPSPALPAAPLRYAIGTLDERFGISRDHFLKSLREPQVFGKNPSG